MNKKLSFVSLFVALALVFSACENEAAFSEEGVNEVYSVVKSEGGEVLYEIKPINPNVFAKFSEPFNNGSVAVTEWATITREGNGNGPVFIQFDEEDLPAGTLSVPVRYKESNNAIWVFNTPAVAGKKIYFEVDAEWGPVTQIRLSGVAFDPKPEVDDPEVDDDCKGDCDDEGEDCDGDCDDEGENDDDEGDDDEGDDDDEGEDDEGEDGDGGNPAAGPCAFCGKKDQGCTYRDGAWNCQSGSGTGSGGNQGGNQQ